jgi:hypothetical protein
MPDVVASFTTPGPCPCCGPQCFLTVSGSGLGGEYPFSFAAVLNGDRRWDSAFFDLATAADYLASGGVAACWLGLRKGEPGDVTSLSANIVGSDYSASFGSSLPSQSAVFKVFIRAATGLTIGCSLSRVGGGTSVFIEARACRNGVLIASQQLSDGLATSISGDLVLAVPEDDFYAILVGFEASGAEAISGALEFSLQSGDGHCRLRAVYGDSFDPGTWQYVVCE